MIRDDVAALQAERAEYDDIEGFPSYLVAALEEFYHEWITLDALARSQADDASRRRFSPAQAAELEERAGDGGALDDDAFEELVAAAGEATPPAMRRRPRPNAPKPRGARSTVGAKSSARCSRRGHSSRLRRSCSRSYTSGCSPGSRALWRSCCSGSRKRAGAGGARRSGRLPRCKALPIARLRSNVTPPPPASLPCSSRSEPPRSRNSRDAATATASCSNAAPTPANPPNAPAKPEP